ncbi:MAG: hypothetical protein IKY64_07050 [Bacteroidaceae bacterium]|jgi:hypothetical protein|nr:hypothetical protein [Bacteroidaceae bacterium]
MASTVFNPIQQHLLKMFAYDDNLERLTEIKALLTKYYAEKVDQRMNQLWDEGILDQQRLDELRGKHLRTEL